MMTQSGFKHGHELTAAIRHIVVRGPTDMAVAYWGDNACNLLRLPDDLTKYRVACDAYSGFCSPTSLLTLLNRGAEIVDVPRLHAKVYRSAAGLVAASANASLRGLSDDEDESFGLEAGIFDDDDARVEKAAAWFDDVFDSGTPVTNGDIREIEDLWKRQRASRPAGSALMAAILERSAALADRTLRVYIYTAGAPSGEAEQQFKDTPYFDGNRWENASKYPFFWGDLPSTISVGDELLCFEVEEGGVTCEGIWRILDRIGEGEQTVWPAVPVRATFARGLGDAVEVCRRTSVALRAGRIAIDAEPIGLPEFAELIAEDDGESVHLAQIQSAEAREAYRFLVTSSAELGLVTSYKLGRVPAVRLHDASSRYVFSFIPNRAHLLFYVRKPALALAPQLAAQARSLGLQNRQNRAGEQTLRVRSREDATTIIDWLKGVLPL
ncbi:phospholipase D family protein [Sphingomonas citri]